jgi:hypothetical protein
LDARWGYGVSLPRGFVKNDGGRGGGIQRFDAASHGNAYACIGATLDFFGKTGAFVANEKGYWLAPIDFPRSEERLFPVAWFVNTRSERANASDPELRKENRKRDAGKNWEMQSSASRGAQGFRRERICSAADAGSGRGGSRCTKGRSSAQDRSHVAGILNASQDDEQRSAG